MTMQDIYHRLRRASSDGFNITGSATRLLQAAGVSRKHMPIAAFVIERNRALTAVGGASGDPLAVYVHERLTARLRTKILNEAYVRGLPAVLDLAKAGGAALTVAEHVFDARTREHVMLLEADGWAHYSRRVGNWRRSLRLLGGVGPQGTWCVRIPGTIDTVHEALVWLEPAAVRDARQDGRAVLRQGDVWVVERKRGGDDLSELPASHSWDPHSRLLRHDGHGELHVPWPCRVYPQRTIAGDGRGRRQGD